MPRSPPSGTSTDKRFVRFHFLASYKPKLRTLPHSNSPTPSHHNHRYGNGIDVAPESYASSSLGVFVVAAAMRSRTAWSFPIFCCLPQARSTGSALLSVSDCRSSSTGRTPTQLSSSSTSAPPNLQAAEAPAAALRAHGNSLFCCLVQSGMSPARACDRYSDQTVLRGENKRTTTRGDLLLFPWHLAPRALYFPRRTSGIQVHSRTLPPIAARRCRERAGSERLSVTKDGVRLV